MALFDSKIINGCLATTDGVYDVDIGIQDGKIAAIGQWGKLPEAEENMDAKDKTILPGGIDTHLHAVDPGFDQMGIDFTSTTRAAALGGVTTVVDMPMQFPPTYDPDSFDVKLKAINSKAVVDFSLWATCKEDDLNSIMPLKEKGVVGFKLVMHASVERSVTPYHNDGVLYEALSEIKRTGLVSSIHCENRDLIAHLERRLKEQGRTDAKAFLESHPPVTELEAINRILFIAKQVGAQIHIAHCSLTDGIDMVEKAKNEGQSVTVETCVHYLTLDKSIFDKKGSLAKVAPALRDRAQLDGLWQRMRDGKIDCVASDHVPYPLQFKGENIWECSAGIPGIQTMFPILIREGLNKNRLTLSRLVEVMSEKPAKICGLYPKKGSTKIGADAYFSIFDLNDEKEIKLEEQIGLEWTLYEGMKAVYPNIVIVRGKPVVMDDKVVGEMGYGELCSP